MPRPNIKLSIVVPCYNEEKNISALIERFNAALSGHQEIELILVDNGSSDQTGSVIDKLIQEHSYHFMKKVTVPVNQGYGFGILSGLHSASGEVLAWTHADLQTDPKDVLRAYELYQATSACGQRIIKGHRKNRKLSEKIFSCAMQLIASAMLGTWIDEINAQPKLFPRNFFDSIKAQSPHDFSLDLYLLYLARKNGYKIISMPVYFDQRRFGEAKGGSGSSWKVRWKLIRRSFAYILALKRQFHKERCLDALYSPPH